LVVTTALSQAFLYYGGGAKFAITDRLSLLGDWTRYELEDTESDVVSLGFTFRF
jgi:hypothetical protein